MNLDANGLPVQSDGDANDQLQRVGMIAVGAALKGDVEALPQPLVIDCITALVAGGLLQPERGVFRRHPHANPNTTTADQLIPFIAYTKIRPMRCDVRFFAQNTHTLEGKRKLLPDILFFRAAPLYYRYSVVRYAADILLVIGALLAAAPVWKDDEGFSRRSPDDVDDMNFICTLAVCATARPTFLSRLACKLYARLRPTNFGVTKLGAANNIQGSLDWYNRTESGGNPEIARLWKPIVERVFYGRTN